MFSKFFIAIFSVIVIFFASFSGAYAQTCSSSRIVNQWACVSKEVCIYRNVCANGATCSESGLCADNSTCTYNVCYKAEGDKECRTTGSQTASCTSVANGCEARLGITTCSGGGGTSGSCKEETSQLTYQCYINDGGGGSSPPPSGGGGNACAWCTNAGQCAASGGTFSDSGGYCGVAGDGCCATGSSGGGDNGGGNPSRPTCDDPECGGRFCDQGDCDSDYHNKRPATPDWNHADQSTIVMPVGQSLATLEWVDNNPVMACWKESESSYELKLEGIDAFGGRVIALQFEGNVGRPSVDGTGDVNREGVVMRYRFTPLFRYYRATVRSINSYCQPNKSPRNGDWTTIEFQVHAQQTGKIFLDVNDDAIVDANGRCVSPSLNEADANTHIISQRNTAPWNTYPSLDGWGWTYRSNWPEVVLAPLGTPFAPSARAGSKENLVDRNLATSWISDARGEDTHRKRIGFTFTAPQEGIQVISVHQGGTGNNKSAPHLSPDMTGINSLGATAPGKSWMITPGISLSELRFNSHTTGFADDERWEVSEIRAWRNPNPTPKLRTTAGSEVINTAGWTNQGGYSINSAMGVAGRMELDLSSDDFTCSCPEGCQYNVSTANANMHYFISMKANPWFQVRDGGVAAYGNQSLAIVNPIPEQCTPARNCTPTLVLTPNSTAPVVMTGGGSVDMSDAPGQQTTGLDDENKNWLARLSATPNRQNFAYFRRIYKFPTQNLQNDFELNFNNATKPSAAPRNGGAAYYQAGNMTIASPWTVNSGESYVILVDGDLNVNANITVASGGFLAFVTSGDVTFASSLGTSTVTSTTPVVEGVFIADDRIRLPASQLKFVGAGTFVGWNGFELARNYESTDNWSAPTELFIYRPDLLRNAPEEMKTPRYEWNEVNP